MYPQYVGSGYPVPPPPSGPLPGYPQPSSPSGYPEYYEFYQGQNQVYPGQPEFNVYPSGPSDQYPFNGNTYGYPEQQFVYPGIENAPKKPQVTTAVPSTVSTLPSGYRKTGQPQLGYTNKPSGYDTRINVPDQTANYDGQKAVIVGKNELTSPSSGSSGHSSSLTPQYVNSPTKTPTKTSSYPSEQESSNLVILSPSQPESSSPVYSVSTKAAENGNSVESSSTVSYQEQFTTLSPDSTTPVNIIPYPLPIVPNPGSCPCYFVPPTSNSSTIQQQPQSAFDLNNLPEGAVIGFIPVVFYPSCGVASKEAISSKLDPVFPSAYQVPYKCSYCEQSESQTASIRSSFDQVVKQSQLNPSVVIKSPSRKSYPNAPIFDQPEFGRKIKVVRRKSKDEQY